MSDKHVGWLQRELEIARIERQERERMERRVAKRIKQLEKPDG